MHSNGNWIEAKESFPRDTLVNVVVKEVKNWGVIVQIEGTDYSGTIDIANFKPEGEIMTHEEYPQVGESFGARVLGYRESLRQIVLSTRETWPI